MKIVHISVVLISVLVLFGACNIFDPLYSDDGSDTFEKALSNADAAMKDNEYEIAIKLYKKALDMRPDSSQAMVRISRAYLLGYFNMREAENIMNAVLTADLTDSETDFLTDINTNDIARSVEGLSNATWWRAPVSGIDRTTGKSLYDTTTKTFSGLFGSDGDISATNRTAMLNYLIMKTVEVAFRVHKNFQITKDLRVQIQADVVDLTNRVLTFMEDVAIYTNAVKDFLLSLEEADTQAEFEGLVVQLEKLDAMQNDGWTDEEEVDPDTGEFIEHTALKIQFGEVYDKLDALSCSLDDAYAQLRATLVEDTGPASIKSLIQVAEVLLFLFRDSSLQDSFITKASDSLANLLDGLDGNLFASLDEEVGNVLDKLREQKDNLHACGEQTLPNDPINVPGVGERYIKSNWFED